MAVVRDHPYAQFRFQVSLGDADPTSVEAGFSEVSGLAAEIDMIEYRSGNSKSTTPTKIPGLTHYPDVILRRGIFGSLALWEWFEDVRLGSPEAARTVRIRLLGEDDEPVMSWTLLRARPVRHESGPFIGDESDVAIEELVLAHEGLDIE